MAFRNARFAMIGFAAVGVSLAALDARICRAQAQPQNRNGNNPAAAAQQAAAQQPQMQNAGAGGRAALPNGQALQPQNLPLAPPFQLTPQDQVALDNMLAKWEKKNDSIKLFMCSFHRWEYDPAFTNDPKQPKAEADGEVKYAAPDKGLFHDTEAWDWTQTQQGAWQKTKAEQGMYWTCDGKSTYEVDAKRKIITETPLPPQLQGVAISNGPLPFVFGAKAATMKERYYMRIIEEKENQILLQAFPKWQKDAGNFSRVELILDAKELVPVAIQIFNPGANAQQQSRSVIMFNSPSINNAWDKLGNLFVPFARPNLMGYKLVQQNNLMPPPNNPPQLPPANGGGTDQARVPKAGAVR